MTKEKVVPEIETATEGRLQALESMMMAQKRMFESSMEALKNAVIDAKAAVEFTKAIDQTAFNEMQDRHRDLTKHVQVLITKITVVTEIGYQARQEDNGLSDEQRSRLLSAAIFCMDCHEGWWEGHVSLTVKDWAARCLRQYEFFTNNQQGVGNG